MKTHLLLFCFICSSILVFSQNQASDFTGNKSDQARNPRNDLINFVPNEVLIKFKDAVPVAAGARMKAAGVNSVDKVLQAHGITSLEKLFPTAQKPQKARMMKSPQGKDITIPSLDKIYRVSVPIAATNNTAPTNIFQLIEELKALPEVEYAEPNYIYSIDNMQPVGPVLTAEDVAKLQTNKQKSATTAFIPNDPLYGQQWYIPAVKADSVWQQTQGDSTQVIAILDTGVDWNHPDLKNKIWINPNPDITNDIRGWDFVNNDNDPMDDNCHGTHVAGIAAAETNNGIGIAGVCPKARIMSIKVFQSSGRGDAATITKGIIYAATHGATVINMSFGSYSRSLTMEDALANAYVTSILVAAAGNDHLNLNDDIPNVRPTIFYPAGLSFVFGTQATNQSTSLSDFSNYDDNGPIFSKFLELQNYELQVPGVNILSTIPNGNYRVFNGTSMAAPILSGAISLYKSIINSESTEVLWAKLIRSSDPNLNLYKAIHSTLSPQLALVTSVLVDTLAGDDKDGRVDANETIQLWYKIRNTGSQTDSAFVGIKFGEFEDRTTAQILIPQVFVGSISTYASKTNELTPLKIHINPSVVNGRDIIFQAYIGFKNSPDTVFQNIKVSVENGQQLEGVMDSTFVLTPDKLWFVNGSFRVGANGTLKIKPGTHLVIDNKVTIRGSLIANGTKDSLIVITSATPSGWRSSPVFYFETSKVIFNYVNFYNLASPLGDGNASISATNCLFEETQWAIGNNISIFTNNMVKNSNFYQFWNFSPSLSKSNVFYNNYLMDRNGLPQTCVYNTYYKNIQGSYSYMFPSALITSESIDTSLFKNNSIINSLGYCNSFLAGGMQEHINLGKQYWGSTVPQTIRKQIFDFNKNSSLPLTILEPMLISPSDSCHGHVWKVLINGKDAQDEYIDPVGTGTQRFEIYFNREMDINYSPQLSFGVRYPYTQQVVADSSSWDSSHKIWTAYKTIKLTTGDGLNLIRVAGAKEAKGWNWEIPIEDARFKFLINAATSSSLDFMATQGLGKVKLEWNNNDLADGLGYNMYRMEHINDSTLTSPIMINSSLITDTLYTDFAVTPNKKYYYYYKILRTNLAETDSSRVVSAIPFTASKGDANGDLSVNVLDITSIVAYLLNNNPQPFILEAADVNSDAAINVLDIVGVVNKVLNGAQKVKGMTLDQQANLYLENDTLFADANVPIGGIQMDISGVSSVEDIQTLKALDGFESGYSMKSDTLRLLYYSMSGKSISAGNHIPLLVLKKDSKITDAVFGGTNGSPIKVNFILTRIPDISNNMNQTTAELGQNYPNPVNGQTIIPIRIYEPVDEAVLRVVNMMGQVVEIIRLENPTIGEHLLTWNSGANKGLFIYTLDVNTAHQRSVCPNKKMIVQ